MGFENFLDSSAIAILIDGGRRQAISDGVVCVMFQLEELGQRRQFMIRCLRDCLPGKFDRVDHSVLRDFDTLDAVERVQEAHIERSIMSDDRQVFYKFQ